MGYTESALAEFESVDIVVGAIIGIACLRGFFLGLIREAFSLASLAAAYIAVKAFVGPVSEWVGDISGGRINEALEPWVAGALLVLVTIGAVTTVGRIIRRGGGRVGRGRTVSLPIIIAGRSGQATDNSQAFSDFHGCYLSSLMSISSFRWYFFLSASNSATISAFFIQRCAASFSPLLK